MFQKKKKISRLQLKKLEVRTIHIKKNTNHMHTRDNSDYKLGYWIRISISLTRWQSIFTTEAMQEQNITVSTVAKIFSVVVHSV